MKDWKRDLLSHISEFKLGNFELKILVIQIDRFKASKKEFRLARKREDEFYESAKADGYELHSTVGTEDYYLTIMKKIKR